MLCNISKLRLKNRICLDIGSSTGGFVDVLLRENAKKVFSVDVGKGQLDWTIRSNKRVVVLEGINARYLSPKLIPDAVDLISCDASFIGLEKILPSSLKLAASGCKLITLIKPQFQVNRSEVGKGGVVRPPNSFSRLCLKFKNGSTVNQDGKFSELLRVQLPARKETKNFS